MNFLCISNYNNDLSWVSEFGNPHIIYDKPFNGISAKVKYPDLNIIEGSSIGYNIHHNTTFIIDNYDKLPDVTVFCKGNVFPRHVSRESFESVVNLRCFAPIQEFTRHNPELPMSMHSCDGAHMEANCSWFLNHPQHPTKYFTEYNKFLLYCFENPVLPNYVTFPPGANFVVPKEYILKYSKTFYQNLRTMVSHSEHPGEAHMIERALFTIWTCNFKPTSKSQNEILS